MSSKSTNLGLIRGLARHHGVEETVTYAEMTALSQVIPAAAVPALTLEPAGSSVRGRDVLSEPSCPPLDGNAGPRAAETGRLLEARDKFGRQRASQHLAVGAQRPGVFVPPCGCEDEIDSPAVVDAIASLHQAVFFQPVGEPG